MTLYFSFPNCTCRLFLLARSGAEVTIHWYMLRWGWSGATITRGTDKVTEALAILGEMETQAYTELTWHAMRNVIPKETYGVDRKWKVGSSQTQGRTCPYSEMCYGGNDPYVRKSQEQWLHEECVGQTCQFCVSKTLGRWSKLYDLGGEQYLMIYEMILIITLNNYYYSWLLQTVTYIASLARA